MSAGNPIDLLEGFWKSGQPHHASALTVRVFLFFPGNVSYVTPTLHTMFGIPTVDKVFPHHPAYTESAGTDEAHTEALLVGKSLALIGWDMLTNDALFETAYRQWKEEIERED